jgi:hypothetical protein
VRRGIRNSIAAGLLYIDPTLSDRSPIAVSKDPDHIRRDIYPCREPLIRELRRAFKSSPVSETEVSPYTLLPIPGRRNLAQLVSQGAMGARGVVQCSFGLLQVLIGWRAVLRYWLVLFQLLDLSSLTIDLKLLC